MADRSADVVIVGGGPTGSAAGVFTGRYGLETVLLDRGQAALPRCAFLANYLGFPAGIDVETFRSLMHEHATVSGCDIVEETATTVESSDGDRRFTVETAQGSTLATDALVAAAWYDGSYLRSITGDGAFVEHVHHGETRERLDPSYAAHDGRTSVEGLYIAAANRDRNDQAIIAAGHGAHVARSLIEDHRVAAGYPEGVAPHYDWLRRESEFSGEWADRERWREWFHNEIDVPVDEEVAEIRERYIDRAFATAVSEEEADARRREAYERLLDHVPDEVIEAYRDADA